MIQLSIVFQTLGVSVGLSYNVPHTLQCFFKVGGLNEVNSISNPNQNKHVRHFLSFVTSYTCFSLSCNSPLVQFLGDGWCKMLHNLEVQMRDNCMLWIAYYESTFQTVAKCKLKWEKCCLLQIDVSKCGKLEAKLGSCLLQISFTKGGKMEAKVERMMFIASWLQKYRSLNYQLAKIQSVC